LERPPSCAQRRLPSGMIPTCFGTRTSLNSTDTTCESIKNTPISVRNDPLVFWYSVSLTSAKTACESIKNVSASASIIVDRPSAPCQGPGAWVRRLASKAYRSSRASNMKRTESVTMRVGHAAAAATVRPRHGAGNCRRRGMPVHEHAMGIFGLVDQVQIEPEQAQVHDLAILASPTRRSTFIT
jgi:hypothetical protein